MPKPRSRDAQHDQRSTKMVVRDLLDQLPDDCTLADIQYHLSVLEAIDRGMIEAAEGHVIPHDVVERELREKWQLGVGG
jgi:hypothetical protein